MTDYPEGNSEILEMIKTGSFDAVRAGNILKGTDINLPIKVFFSLPDGSYKSSYLNTYLGESVTENNLPAVAFFLENGADPNYINEELLDESALWDIQFIDPDQDWKTRYQIAKLFFSHGADPNIMIENETLYDHVLYKVYNDSPNDDNDWENLRHFYLLLVVYGGGGVGYGKPVLKDIDFDKIDEYDVKFYLCEDGFHVSGVLVDGDGNEIGNL